MKSKSKKLNIVFLLVMLCFVAVLCYFVRPANDDFYYRTFLDGDFSHFIKESVTHYKTVMGRFFVHIVLCPLLAYDMMPFKIFNVVMILATAFVGAKIASATKKETLKNTVLFLAVFWLVGGYVLSDGVLWGAGSLNYLFPAFLGLSYFYLFSKTFKKPNYLLLIFTPFAATTTELGGILVIFSIFYFVFTDWQNAKKHKLYISANLLVAAVSYATLFVSGGIKERFSANEVSGVSLIDTIVANFSIFVRKILSPYGLVAVIVLVLLAFLLLAIKNKKYIKASICAVSMAVVVLVATGVLYHLWQVSIVGVLCFLALWINAVLSKDKVIIFFMFAVSVSLGVCVVSPVVGDRMLFPCGIYLVVMFVRTVALCRFSEKTRLVINTVLTVFAIVSLGFLISKFSQNAQIVDKNLKATKECDGIVLLLEDVPDELYGNGTVPSTMNFGDSYLAHYGIENATIVNEADQKTRILCGVEYIPIKEAKAHGAIVRWHLSCAEIEIGEKIYRFSKGANVADLNNGKSVKLEAPVRIINGTTYIPQKDYVKILSLSQ